ncbi:hypothetical protein DZF91_08355 [Actinomadura logoneensis]|uniref:Uncharacterized protein n=1 Tax=Actinomadura logoneensis TaxID=2293572 RepID=A0A372JPY0_9ACTN|nr:hypothetical protein [Actinomadura logoneensis]RFU42095.1 hypothetical protein DZF91_08355 [Actinomadura logoneensis]
MTGETTDALALEVWAEVSPTFLSLPVIITVFLATSILILIFGVVLPCVWSRDSERREAAYRVMTVLLKESRFFTRELRRQPIEVEHPQESAIERATRSE